MSEDEDRTNYESMNAPHISQPMHAVIEALVYIDSRDDLAAIIGLVADKLEEEHHLPKTAEALRSHINE